MASFTEACIIFLFFSVVEGIITTVSTSPEVSSYNMAGKITSTTALLNQPYCFFSTAPQLCQVQCDIYVVPAVGSGVDNFNSDETNPKILQLSPYPTAFAASSSKNYFLTRVGQLSSFPCMASSTITYVRVGSDGNCNGINCNGALPAGSTVRFKYILVNTTNNQILMDTSWSGAVTLNSVINPATINNGLKRRSAGMIIITAILCVLFFVLLLLLILALICGRRFSTFTEREPLPALGSLRVKKYDTHNLQEPQSYTNTTYADDFKKFSTDEVLTTNQKPTAPDLQDSVKLQRYQKFMN
ncbi:uroplakin-3b [Brienomyrus brachyistius]|uniref:uroplakin-3b n=1 Tax=Brienomyrus brachyistius TaxID=42636 RepID=UPI0020B3F028|nr:uroplakin-3b [Brienomyrus brachyistius]